MKTIIILLVAACLVHASFGQNNDTDAIKKLILNYKVSINNADTVLGAKVWADIPEVSFIQEDRKKVAKG